ncbi:AAA family ATPase [Agrococcus sp. SCSIO52902]|uniref:AAA family ATPase n=1 Tax=Agrococcus sp. SCSIO52902 TaxID=2933290 RepID=UPI001FF1BD9C|nr:AAA family ATPase [Agrococcus sp. SCSIO52902]UOV99842.1 AAA family ATPase [Agrococcus sp. SCSIO52902]
MREDETEIRGDGPVDEATHETAGARGAAVDRAALNEAEAVADAAEDAILDAHDAPEPGPDRSLAPEPAAAEPAPRVRRREGEWQAWADALRRVGGRSPLTDFIDTTATRIELSTTHPGGLAQFITGRPTALSSLIRDDLALRAARSAAAAIASKGIELAAARSIDAVHLGIGMARFPHADAAGGRGEVYGPVLLRPLVVRRRGRDFELQLLGRPFVNPRIASILRGHHGVRLDERQLIELGSGEGTFTPNAVLDALRQAAAHVPGFTVEARLLASTFADVGEPMAADLQQQPHDVLDAVRGDEQAAWRVREGRAGVDETPQDSRDPEVDRLVLDADAEQDAVIAEAAAGNSLVVEALPGTGLTQTIVNVIAALVGDDRRVLVVSPRRATLRDIGDRLASTKLESLAVSEATLRRDLIGAIRRIEQSERPDTGEIDEAMLRLRKVLLDYRAALQRVDPKLQVSVLDALKELSRLAMLPTPPSTRARLSEQATVALATDRPRVAATMRKAAALGQFRYGPSDTPWYGASFDSSGDASAALADSQALAGSATTGPGTSGGDLEALLTEARRVIGDTKLRPAATLAELGIQVALLTDVRATLDVMTPSLYDRPLGELITATGPRREAIQSLGAMQRRRLKKLAEEYIRPGSHVPDLHDVLVAAQQQRRLWAKFAPDGSIPSVPAGLAALDARLRDVVVRLDRLDAALKPEVRSVDLPIEELEARIAELAAPSDALQNIQERAELMSSVERLGLDALLTDFADRHVADDQVEHELDLAWWQSALQSMLGRERALLRGNTDVLRRLEQDFALVDEAHVDASSARLAHQVAQGWRLAVDDHPDEADALRRLIKAGPVDADELQRLAPHLTRSVAPVWLASPYDLHRVPKRIPFDAVIIADAGAITIAEAAGAISRARQVIALGDSATQTPAPFDVGISTLGIRPSEELATPDELHAESALSRLGQVLPTLHLTRSYRTGGADLVAAVNERFYEGRIEALPWAGAYLGHASLTASIVHGAHGLPEQGAATVESPDAEVDRVVQLVTQHARSRPQESLMVVTANEKHEVRIQQAVMAALASSNQLTDFVVADREEPFVIVDVTHASALSRDRVIFSVGYGRTKHGRNVDFGTLGQPGGERLLAVAMTRARKALQIVTSFDAAELDPERLAHGAAMLREILLDIAAEDRAPTFFGGDPLMVDLATRLRRRGLRADVSYDDQLPLVVANGGICAAIEADHDDGDRTLREALRLRPEVLRRFGWHTMRVHAFELFTDPEGVADRIAELVGADASS